MYFGKEAEDWFSELAGKKIKLVKATQILNTTHLKEEDEVRFGFDNNERTMHSGHSDSPVLVINQASLDYFKEKAEVEDFEIGYKLFRANIVFKGENPFEEDHVRDFTIVSKEN